MRRDDNRGHRIHLGARRAGRRDIRVDRRLCGTGAATVNWAYAVSGALALALLIYLVVALLRAEDL